MIEQLTFIEELKKVKKHKHCPQMINAIDDLIVKYKLIVEENEEAYQPREIEKIDSPLIFPVSVESS
jgi:hypothetical protein